MCGRFTNPYLQKADNVRHDIEFPNALLLKTCLFYDNSWMGRLLSKFPCWLFGTSKNTPCLFTNSTSLQFLYVVYLFMLTIVVRARFMASSCFKATQKCIRFCTMLNLNEHQKECQSIISVNQTFGILPKFCFISLDKITSNTDKSGASDVIIKMAWNNTSIWSQSI